MSRTTGTAHHSSSSSPEDESSNAFIIACVLNRLTSSSNSTSFFSTTSLPTCLTMVRSGVHQRGAIGAVGVGLLPGVLAVDDVLEDGAVGERLTPLLRAHLVNVG